MGERIYFDKGRFRWFWFLWFYDFLDPGGGRMETKLWVYGYVRLGRGLMLGYFLAVDGWFGPGRMGKVHATGVGAVGRLRYCTPETVTVQM